MRGLSIGSVLFVFTLSGCDGAAPADAGARDAASAGDAGVGEADAGGRDAGVDAGPRFPTTLSAAGLYRDEVGGELAEGVRPYAVRYPLWSDGSSKRRFLWLPPGTAIDASDPDGWRLPVGTRLFKEFSVGSQVVETRLLWKVAEGDWESVSYVWRADGSDADAAPAGAPDAAGTAHDVPDQGECVSCHRGAADFALGVSAVQLDRASFDAWVADGALPADAAWSEPPGDETWRAALGYLHGNCGHCHSDAHPLAQQRALRLWLPAGLEDPLAAPAYATSAGLPAHHDLGAAVLLTPGDPNASQLYTRMGRRDDTAMPTLGTERVDEAGSALVARWIRAAPAR